jgi:oligoendopeptidase F
VRAKKGTTAKSPEALLEVMKLRDQINIQIEKLSAYATMLRDEDMRRTGRRSFISGHKPCLCNGAKPLPGCSRSS